MHTGIFLHSPRIVLKIEKTHSKQTTNESTKLPESDLEMIRHRERFEARNQGIKPDT